MANSKTLVQLVALLALVVAYPLFEHGAVPRVALSAMLSLVLLTSVLKAGYNVRQVKIGFAIGVPTLLVTWLNALEPSGSALVPELLLWLLFYSYTTAALLRYVMAKAEVTRKQLYGAASAFMLLGLSWATLYQLLGTLDPRAFYVPAALDANQLLSWADYVYFSFSTLTTTGFGDIVPVAPFARSLATLESITGTLYAALLVARLVALYGQRHGLARKLLGKG